MIFFHRYKESAEKTTFLHEVSLSGRRGRHTQRPVKSLAWLTQNRCSDRLNKIVSKQVYRTSIGGSNHDHKNQFHWLGLRRFRGLRRCTGDGGFTPLAFLGVVLMLRPVWPGTGCFLMLAYSIWELIFRIPQLPIIMGCLIPITAIIGDFWYKAQKEDA